MSEKVLLLNAPPDTGKDLAASMICNYLNNVGIKAQHKEFKNTLFIAVKAAYGISEEVWSELYTRENKELPSYYLVNNGKSISPRQAMINMSEDVMKPLFGSKVFGIAAANQLEEGLNVFSDSGFDDEAQALIDKVGKSNVYCIQITREGRTFEGDSRDWLNIYRLGINTVPCNNYGDETDYWSMLLKSLIQLGIINE